MSSHSPIIPPQRFVAHFDLDSFFVSVEIKLNPLLKGLPVVVGGSKERGVVSAASYEARKFGVHSAMPMKRALQLCPQAVVVKSHFEEYRKYSRMVTQIIAARAPLFEKASVDEFYLDLTGMDTYFDVLDWTKNLRQEIIDATGLPISFGLATNKLVAKIATDEAKPNGYLFVQPGSEAGFLAPLKVSKIPGVGDATYTALRQLNISTIGDLQRIDAALLQNRLGKHGHDLHRKAMGIHHGEVSPYHDSKSVSTEHTFSTNTADEVFLQKELVRLTEKVGWELRKEGKTTRTVTVKLRYFDFETVSRQMAVPPTLRDDEVLKAAQLLFARLYQKGRLLRLMGIRLSELSDAPQQANLFEDSSRKNDLYRAMDEVKQRFGLDALHKASIPRKQKS